MLIRRERPEDVEAIGAVQSHAFARPDQPGEVFEAVLVDRLRTAPEWIPELSLVAVDDAGAVVGHVVCTRGHVEGRPALALGPIGVLPDLQGRGVGNALMHAVLGAADARGEVAVVLLGSPDLYRRFGFDLADRHGVVPPVASWAPYFQLRRLTAYDESLRGTFRYAKEFGEEDV